MKIFILILAAFWVAFFLWPLVQRRFAGGHRDSIGAFTKKVTVIGRAGGHLPRRTRTVAPAAARPLGAPVGFRATGGLPSGLPMSASARRRRRDALGMLGLAVLGSLAVAVFAGSLALWIVQIAIDLGFVAYVALLVHLRRRADEHRAKVHFLPPPRVSPSPALVLHRSVSS